MWTAEDVIIMTSEQLCHDKRAVPDAVVIYERGAQRLEWDRIPTQWEMWFKVYLTKLAKKLLLIGCYVSSLPADWFMCWQLG